MTKFLYFAYGSNMLTERLKARCPGALPVGIAFRRGLVIAFSKRSVDDSGKATLLPQSDPASLARGVLFEIDAREESGLSKAEGKDYEQVENFEITLDVSGGQGRARTYLARREGLDPGVRPYDWYLELVVAGTRQHGLPAAYAERLRQVEALPDPKPERKSRREAIALLNRLGVTHGLV
jgi:gamma-glutamylcyclotransferase